MRLALEIVARETNYELLRGNGRNGVDSGGEVSEASRIRHT
jgi:hypothetical protein